MSDRRGSMRSASKSIGGIFENLNKYQRTLALIKPDAYGAGKKDEIISKLTEAGFKIILEKELQLTESLAKEFYAEHSEKPFFSDLVSWMSRHVL